MFFRSKIETVRNAFMGTRRANADHEQALLAKPSIISGVRHLEKLCPIDAADDRESPIFLFSTGWRTGSTFLQRLLISDSSLSDSSLLVWGEPYNVCGLIQNLAQTAIPFREDWPPPRYYYNATAPASLKDEWIANLYPPLDDLWRGHRALFDSMFADPAKRAGASRWGIKEVRLGIEHAYYLRWLYPKARFLFLYRNPLASYRSYVGFGRDCYYTWPDRPVYTPTAFGSLWRQLMEGFLSDGDKVGGLLVRYEDITKGDDLVRKIEDYLAIHIDRSLLNTKIGGSADKKGNVGRLERWLLKRAVSPIAQTVGYTW
jgi:Sulfotransferase family